MKLIKQCRKQVWKIASWYVTNAIPKAVAVNFAHMNQAIPHPSSWLSATQTDIIRAHAPAAEAAAQLQPAQIALALEQRWFTMLVPQQYNGAQKALPDVVRLEEALAWADGSMAWVVTLCAGAGWFGGFLTPSFASTIFANSNACLAGSGAPTGTAEETAAGYRISGKWLHASGAPHNTIFTANCIITRNGKELTMADGQPVIKAFAFTREEVTIIPAWQSFGLIATASHAFAVEQLLVAPERMFVIEQEAAVIAAPLYQYPFLQLAEVTLAANIAGMTMHFMDEVNQQLPQKRAAEAAILHPQLQEATQLLQQARQDFYTTLDQSWQQQVEEQRIDASLLQQVSDTSRKLALQSRQQVDRLYPYCGLAAANSHATINRVWRDIHTASQHSLLVYPRL